MLSDVFGISSCDKMFNTSFRSMRYCFHFISRNGGPGTLISLSYRVGEQCFNRHRIVLCFIHGFVARGFYN